MVTSLKSLVPEHGKQCMPCSANFSVTIQTETLSTEISKFLKQIIFPKKSNLCSKRNSIKIDVSMKKINANLLDLTLLLFSSLGICSLHSGSSQVLGTVVTLCRV